MNLVEKVRELEEALCQANGKLFAIQDACERVITESSGSSPSAQLAKQISNLIGEGEE